jgi:hypothetical protein
MDDDVVDAHGHQVDADGVMAVHEDGDSDLGAHAVGGGDQDRVPVFVHAQVEEAAESADFPQDAGAISGPYQGPDGADKGVSFIDIDPGIFIGADFGHPLCLPFKGCWAL